MNEIETVSYLYRNKMSISNIAKQCGFGEQKVRKMLITTGDIDSPISREINKMHNDGMQIAEIAERMDMSISAVNSYMPYKKGIYMSETPSENAIKLRTNRERAKHDDSKMLNPKLSSAPQRKTSSGTNKNINFPKYKKAMVHVWGDEAVFQRAEIKKDICSYEVITPSAARGILDSIYWHPGLQWIIDRIYVINPITYKPDKVTLKNVDYIIEAHFEMTENATEGDNEGKFKDIFLRRLRRQQPFNPVYFGSQNYPAHFEEFHGNINDIKSFYRQTTKDLGILFYDFDYQNNDEPLFFRAILKYGVLSLNNINILR